MFLAIALLLLVGVGSILYLNYKSLVVQRFATAEVKNGNGRYYSKDLWDREIDKYKEIVKEIFSLLYNQGFLKESTMKQYCSINKDGSVKFLPDRYVEGMCPRCKVDGARGDQCDECGATFENNELINPRSKLDPNVEIKIKDTEHLFFRLELFQNELEKFALENNYSKIILSDTDVVANNLILSSLSFTYILLLNYYTIATFLTCYQM